MTYTNRSKCTQPTDASISHWEMELIQADEELRQLEREQALKSVSMLMQHDEIAPDVCGIITTNDRGPAT
jgi:hypothetical protein